MTSFDRVDPGPGKREVNMSTPRALCAAVLLCATAVAAEPRLREHEIAWPGLQTGLDPSGKHGPKRMAGYFSLDRTVVRSSLSILRTGKSWPRARAVSSHSVRGTTRTHRVSNNKRFPRRPQRCSTSSSSRVKPLLTTRSCCGCALPVFCELFARG